MRTRQMRSMVTIPILAWLLSMRAGPLSAQLIVGPGSTPQGDILRGEGVMYMGLGNMYMGLGSYTLNSAQAVSINTDTWMRLNEYIFQGRQEQIKRYNERLQARSENRNQNLAEIRRRIRENPTESDLMNGDALNLVLEEISDPRIHPSTLRSARVSLSGETLQKIPFHCAAKGGIISMRRLTVGDEWPVALRGEAFLPERKAYHRAVDAYLEQALERKVSKEAVEAVKRAVSGLNAKLVQTIPTFDREMRLQGQNFIAALEKQAKVLQEAEVEAAVAEFQRFPGTSVAELVEFMLRYNLQFSPAESPGERDLYKALYHVLLGQRQALAQAGFTGQPIDLRDDGSRP